MDVPSSSASSIHAGGKEDDPDPSVFLMELVTLDHLMMTTSSSRRSKLTCLTASPQFLLLGTSTGGVSVYNRFSSTRKRLNTPSGPLHFINTKDGPVSTLCVAPNDGLVAIGSESGRVHVVEISATPSPVKHLLTRDTRKLKKVTSIAWSADSKTFYSGHANGVVMAHFLDVKFSLRSSCAVVATFDGNIVQLDLHGSNVLVSTQTASYLCNAKDKAQIQIGKKSRNGAFGACFVQPESDTAPSLEGNAFVLAARPNGRIWEANFAGVVYRTHQLQENTTRSNPPILSLRSDFSPCGGVVGTDSAGSNAGLTLGVLHHVTIDRMPYVLSVCGSRLVVIDLERSKIVLVNDFEEEITCCCVCGSDIFLILQGIAIPRKYTLCSCTEVVKRLQAKSLHAQTAQFILQYKNLSWSPDLIQNTIASLAETAKKMEHERLRDGLQAILNGESSSECGDVKAIKSSPENHMKVADQEGGKPKDGVRSVRQRRRVRSSSCDAKSSPTAAVRKRASFPRSLTDILQVSVTKQTESDSRGVEMSRKDAGNFLYGPIFVIFALLAFYSAKPASVYSRNLQDTRCRIVGSDSLRTLLQMQSPYVVDEVQFVPTVTVGNAAKSLAELAISTPVSFSQMLPADDPPVIHAQGNVIVKRRSGPNIVKAVKPHKVKPVASVRPFPAGQQYIKSPTEQGTGTDHNQLNANNVGSGLTSSPSKVIPCHDEENNMHIVDTQWVIGRISQLRLKDDEASDNNSVSTNTSATERSISKPSSPNNSIDTERCSQCNIHKSWVVASLLATICQRIKIIYTSSDSDSVPITRGSWKALLQFKLSSQRSEKSPCVQCETALSRCINIFKASRKSLDLVPDGVRPNARKTHERCTAVDEERIYRVLFDSCLAQSSLKNSRISTASSSVENGTQVDNSAPVIRNADDREQVQDRHPSEEKRHIKWQSMEWILAVDVRIVFAIAALVIGYRELISILKECPALLRSLSMDHWTSLSLLCAREQSVKKEGFNPQVISSILLDCNINSFTVSPLTTKKPIRREGTYSQAPMYSWIIDSNGSCPVCTVSLKSDAGEKELSITSFICGHAYHTLCLSKRYAGCIMCRGRMKNANVPKHSISGQ
ncbi:hypothetical protein Q1695_008605 [Nippostrongylus brasiliensis]|nr:hypothetical protein Q1695_008605 [Nippostrongylus brasiliensis]